MRLPYVAKYGNMKIASFHSNAVLLLCLSSISCCGKIWKHENCIFSLKCCITALPEFNQLLLDFSNLVHLQIILMLLYDPLNLVIH